MVKHTWNSPNFTHVQCFGSSEALLEIPFRDDHLISFILWLFMLRKACNIQRTRSKPCQTPEGLFRSTFCSVVPKAANCSISQPPQVYFKWFLRTRVQFGKTILPQFTIRTIKVYEIILCLKSGDNTVWKIYSGPPTFSCLTGCTLLCHLALNFVLFYHSPGMAQCYVHRGAF